MLQKWQLAHSPWRTDRHCTYATLQSHHEKPGRKGRKAKPRKSQVCHYLSFPCTAYPACHSTCSKTARSIRLESAVQCRSSTKGGSPLCDCFTYKQARSDNRCGCNFQGLNEWLKLHVGHAYFVQWQTVGANQRQEGDRFRGWLWMDARQGEAIPMTP